MTAVNQFATEWQADDIHRTYDQSHEQFRRRFSFDDYSRWLASVQQSWGRLEKIEVRDVERAVPMNEMYQAQVEFDHEKGASRGSLTFVFDGNTPRLAGTVLDDRSRHPTL